MPQRYTPPEVVRQKAFKQRILLSPINEKRILLLSRVMAHLWNMGVVQAETWLSLKN